MSRPARAPIRRLDAAVVERIAAGEVVERPASVVKELVENAVDAGATEVRVTVRGGGLLEIRVDDDGGGIPAEELALAVARHATSKLRSAEGLESIATLGFRGEALAAIGAVGRLAITSRIEGEDEAHEIHVDGGVVSSVGVAARPPGTTVQVRDLFFNTPARRRFQRSAPAELVEIAAVLQHLYLARPSVAVLFATDSGEVARYPRADSLRDAAAWALGDEFLEQSFPVDAPLVDGVRVAGVLGRPAIARGRSTALLWSVNGRAVSSRALSQMVRVAFSGYLPKTKFPTGVLALTVDPTRVDVNVHPTKREVRLLEERAMGDALAAVVRTALLHEPHVATGTVRPTRAEAIPPSRAEPASGLGGTGGSPMAAERSRARQTALTAPTRSQVAAGPHHPSLRFLGCLYALYWVAEGPDGLVLVDQHAASERVLFDALRRGRGVARQELLEPGVVRLTAPQRAALDAHRDAVLAAGFEVVPFGPDQVRVQAVPSFLGHRMAPEAFRPMLDELAEGGRPTLPDGLTERVAASIACHAAVRAGDVIEASELSRILAALYALPDAAYACPHGRPILVTWSRGRLDRQFLRAGDAGHA